MITMIMSLFILKEVNEEILKDYHTSEKKRQSLLSRNDTSLFLIVYEGLLTFDDSIHAPISHDS
jgi:hypothetical protein